MIRTESSWSRFPTAPNIIAHRRYGLTSMPVRPSVPYFKRLPAGCPVPAAARYSGANGTAFNLNDADQCSDWQGEAS
jgi:hypothetical protein